LGLIADLIWWILWVFGDAVDRGNNLHKHLVSQSDELKCRDASNVVIFHAIQVLSKSLGCEDQWGEEVRYLARQIKEALMYISVCIIVTEV
jgi:hypothetical protein